MDGKEVIYINTDASITKERINVAAVIKSWKYEKNTRKTFSRKVNNYKNDSCFAEVLGITTALEWIIRYKNKLFCSNKHIIILNDNQVAIKKFSNKNKRTKSIKKIISYINNELNSTIKFYWLNREQNDTADKLCDKYFI